MEKGGWEAQETGQGGKMLEALEAAKSALTRG